VIFLLPPIPRQNFVEKIHFSDLRISQHLRRIGRGFPPPPRPRSVHVPFRSLKGVPEVFSVLDPFGGGDPTQRTGFSFFLFSGFP